MTIERLCPRCGDPIPPSSLRYCSINCKNAMRRRRTRRTSPSAQRRAARQRRDQRSRGVRAYDAFRNATRRSTNLAVAETDAHQRQARQLIAAGFAAYVNRAGFVRDVAMPRAAADAGRIFAVAVLEREAQR